MNIEATAEALATDTAMPVVAENTAPEISEDDQLGALYDSGQEVDDQTPDEPTEAVQDEPQDTDEHVEVEAPAPKTDAPSDLPHQVKQHWGDIPETARAAILDSQRDMSRKLADQGRLMQGINPIRDALVDASKNFPALMDMKPEQLARDVMQLAQQSQNFTAKPVETMMGLIKQHGLEGAIQQALAGQPVTAGNTSELQNTVKRLEAKIAELSNPDYLNDQFTNFSTQANTLSAVNEFASSAEHWASVEDKMPVAVQFMTEAMPEGTSQKDVLKAAYELAVSQFAPNAKAKPDSTAEEAVAVADPERSKAALKAKSVNVNSRSTGKARTMSEDDLLSATFDKMQN